MPINEMEMAGMVLVYVGLFSLFLLSAGLVGVWSVVRRVSGRA